MGAKTLASPKKVLVAGVSGPSWRVVVERLGARGYTVSHREDLPRVDSPAFDPQEYELVAFGLPPASEVQLPYVREMCAQVNGTKLLLLGNPLDQVTMSELDPWGKLSYLPDSSMPDALADQILQCLDEDWLVWGSTSTDPEPRVLVEAPPEHLRPLLLAGRALLHHLRSLTPGSSFDGAIHDVLSRIAEVLTCESSSFLAWDPAEGELVLQASAGPRAARSLGVRQKLEGSVAGWVVERKRPLLVWDLERVARFAHRPKRKRSGRSFVCVPVGDEENFFGVLTAGSSREDVFTSVVMTALTEVAAELASALGIVRQLRETREGRSRASLVIPVGDGGAAKPLQDTWDSPLVWPELLRALPVGLVALDRELNVTFYNQRAAEILSCQDPLSKGEALGRMLNLDGNHWRSTLSRVLQEGRSEEFHHVCSSGSPQQKWLHLMVSPFRDEGGRVLGALVAFLEVSNSASLEGRLARIERQALLGELTSKVAHEINNALDGVMRFVSLALRTRSDAQAAQEYLEEAHSGLHRMANVAARLLKFSRGGGSVKQDASVGEMIQEALRFFAARAQEQGVNFQVDVSDPVSEVRYADLFEVFTNLIKNALEVMPAGGRLTVSTCREGNQAVVRFTDTGPGMSEEVRERLFQPFFTTKRSGEGTGLGLAISQDIVRRCNGSIEAESRPENGATFVLRFPLPEPAI